MKIFIDKILQLDVKKIGILIFLVALLPRFVWFFVKGRYLDITIPAGGDAIGYDQLAVNLVKHHQYAFEPGKPTAYREPVYPYFLAIIYSIFGISNYTAVRVVQILISSLTCVIIFLLTIKFFDKKVALLAGLISCFWPHFIYYSTTILRETLFCFLLICSVFFLNQFYQGSGKILTLVFTGIFCGLTALINSTSLIFLFFSFLIISFITKKIKQGLIIILVFSIVYSFWVVRNYKVFNTIVLGSTVAGVSMYGNLAIPWEVLGTPEEYEYWSNDAVAKKAYSADNEIITNKIFLQASLEIIKKDPWKNLVIKSIKRFIKLYRFYPHRGKGYAHSETVIILVNVLSYGLLFPFFIYGFFANIKNFLKYFLLYFVLISFTVLYSLIWSVIRYRLPLEPYIIIFACYSINKIMSKIFT